MIENKLKLLESIDNFEENKNKIVEAFISFYGEEKRDIITEKFNNSIILPYVSIDDLKSILRKIRMEKTNELYNKLKERVELSGSILNIIEESNYFDDNLLSTYYKYLDKVKEANDPSYSNNFFLTDIDSTITAKNILEGNQSELMKEMNKIRPIVEELQKEYDELNQKIVKYDEYVDLDDIKIELDSKYLYTFALRHKDLLGDEFKIIENDYSKYKNIYTSSCPKLKMYCGSVMSDSMPDISAFDAESDEVLKGNNEFMKDEIKETRIKYYKMKGIDLGDDYSLYENNDNCRAIRPSLELINELKQEKEIYIKKYKEEVLEHYPIYNKCKGLIDNIPFMEDVDLANVFETGLMSVSPNFIKENGKIKNFSLVYLNLGNDTDGLDINIIHEFNHLYELELLEADDKKYSEICGWDIIKGEYSVNDDETRKYEKFNEIVNDLIAELVCRNMHEKDNYLYSSKDSVKYNACNYRRTTFLVADFLKEFKDKVFESRTGDMSIILDHVGQENFEELNSLFPEFEEHFGGFKILNWIDAVKNGEKNELTEKREEIERRRDEIIERMKVYSLEQQKKTM
ncbi:MAG: hypothetical protein J6O56_03665 [Bacilli bacterium]|nr:hypothetical protein [Bacilli bacterium]